MQAASSQAPLVFIWLGIDDVVVLHVNLLYTGVVLQHTPALECAEGHAPLMPT
jgi:hypothetical protein